MCYRFFWGDASQTKSKPFVSTVARRSQLASHNKGTHIWIFFFGSSLRPKTTGWCAPGDEQIRACFFSISFFFFPLNHDLKFLILLTYGINFAMDFSNKSGPLICGKIPWWTGLVMSIHEKKDGHFFPMMSLRDGCTR